VALRCGGGDVRDRGPSGAGQSTLLICYYPFLSTPAALRAHRWHGYSDVIIASPSQLLCPGATEPRVVHVRLRQHSLRPPSQANSGSRSKRPPHCPRPWNSSWLYPKATKPDWVGWRVGSLSGGQKNNAWPLPVRLWATAHSAARRSQPVPAGMPIART